MDGNFSIPHYDYQQCYRGQDFNMPPIERIARQQCGTFITREFEYRDRVLNDLLESLEALNDVKDEEPKENNDK